MSQENNDENVYEAPAANLDEALEEELGGRGARLGAAIIDNIINLVVVIPLVFLFGLGNALLSPNLSMWILAGIAGLGMTAYALIHGYFLATRGQTLGKMAVGVKIVDAESKETIALWKVLGVRVFVIQALSAIPTVGLIFVLVDALFIFSERRRCLHDWLAGTIVIKA